MAVLAMKRISIYALKANRKKILEQLQLKGAVEVTSEKLGDDNFSQMDTSSARSTFEKNALLNINAVEALDKVVAHEKAGMAMFNGKTPLSTDDYVKASKHAANITRMAQRLLGASKKMTDAEADILRLETQIAALEPWANLDIPMRTLATKSTNIYIGSFPEPLTEQDIKMRLAEICPDVEAIEIEIINSMPMQTNVFIMASSSYGFELEKALRSMGLTYPASPPKIPPADKIRELETEISALKAEVEECREEIRQYATAREDFLIISDYYYTRAEKYRVLGGLWQSKHVFVVSGYVPEEESEEIRTLFEKEFDAYVEVEDVPEDEEAPVKLKNNWFAAPVEGVVEAYSMPSKREVDPSSVMAGFYYLLFGLMLSDAAYGLIMTIGSAIILHKFKNMADTTRKTFTMFKYCGISTTLWGILFGSYFGDAIQVISRTFFGHEVGIPPVWFTPLNLPIKLLMFSFLLGIIHLFTGLGVQFYQCVKRGDIKSAIYDTIFWYLLIGGLIVALVSTEMFQNMADMTFNIPQTVVTACLILAAIGAVGIVATAGRESKNPFKRLLKGLYGLYNISGYLSDILSYSRLLALGLATGVISSVFNELGSMMGGGVGGAIFFVVVFAIGHTLNIAINALGAYVHTNRLQYVEFFGKFYEGGGKKFEPFAEKTQYYKFTEEKKNEL